MQLNDQPMLYFNLSTVPVCTRYCHGVPSPSCHTLHPDPGQVLHQTWLLPGLHVTQTKLTPTEDYQKYYLKRRKLLLKNVFCSSMFMLLNNGTLHLYITQKSTHFIRTIMQTNFEMIINAMHRSNNVMNLMCRLRFIRVITSPIHQNCLSKGENSYLKNEFVVQC